MLSFFEKIPQIILSKMLMHKSMKTIKCQGQTIKASGKIEDTESIQNFSIAYLRNEQDQDLMDFRTKFDVYTLESSFYQNGKIESIVNRLIEQGHTYQKDKALRLKTTSFGDDKDRVMKKTDGSYTYFIPDIAANHDGSLSRAKKLIKLCALAGANAAKFQHFKADTIVSDFGFNKIGKLTHQSKWKKSVYQVYK